MTEKGVLLYDECPLINKRMVRNRIKIMFETISIIIAGVFFLYYYVVINIVDDFFFNLYIVSVSIFLLFIGGLFLISIYGVINLRIYSKGISLPNRNIKDIIKGEETFISFSDIREIYINNNKPLEWISIIIKGNNNFNSIFKSDIIDINKFIHYCSIYVPIIRDRDWN